MGSVSYTHLKKLGVNVDKGSGSLEDMDDAAAATDKRVDALGEGVQREGAGIVSTLQGMLSQALRTEQALMIQAAMGVDAVSYTHLRGAGIIPVIPR